MVSNRCTKPSLSLRLLPHADGSRHGGQSLRLSGWGPDDQRRTLGHRQVRVVVHAARRRRIRRAEPFPASVTFSRESVAIWAGNGAAGRTEVVTDPEEDGDGHMGKQKRATRERQEQPLDRHLRAGACSSWSKGGKRVRSSCGSADG
jgi:hypothetical protein